MKPEKQHIAIAEACEWTRVWDSAFRQWIQRSPDDTCVRCDPDPNAGWETHVLPDYLNDLNAIGKAVSSRDEEEQNQFCIELAKILTRAGYVECCEFHRNYVNATPAQRAESLLRALGKWEESA